MQTQAATMPATAVPATAVKKTNIRWVVVAVLFIITAINYADRATISLAGPAIAKELNFNAVTMGYIFSAFGWSYVIAQLPGGWLLDRFGSKLVYAFSIFFWSLFTLLVGAVGFLTGLTAVGVLVFAVMGVLGMLFVLVWNKLIYDPKDHPLANAEEVAYIEKGGGLVSMDQKPEGAKKEGPDLKLIGQLLRNRMLAGIYIAQYCINALTYFFITWFPVYLVKEKHMTILKAGFVAAIPAVCGFLGGVLGGIISDALLKRGYSLSVARKTPIVAGMLLSMTMVACNYVDAESAVIFFMALAFFGKGVGALGWAVNSDTAPKQIAGLSGAVLNTCGNLSSITTPIAIGYIIESTGSFNGALVYVGAHAFVAIVCYLFVVGKIQRVTLK